MMSARSLRPCVPRRPVARRKSAPEPSARSSRLCVPSRRRWTPKSLPSAPPRGNTAPRRILSNPRLRAAPLQAYLPPPRTTTPRRTRRSVSAWSPRATSTATVSPPCPLRKDHHRRRPYRARGVHHLHGYALDRPRCPSLAFTFVDGASNRRGPQSQTR